MPGDDTGLQDEAADPPRRLADELLRQGATERHAEDVDAVVAELVEHPVDQPCDRSHPSRDSPAGRLAGAGSVEADRLDGCGGERPFEGLPHFDVAADAHQQQQRVPFPPHRGANAQAVDLDAPDPALSSAVGLARVFERPARAHT